MTLPAPAQQSRKTLGTLLTLNLLLAYLLRFLVVLCPPLSLLNSHLFALLPVMLLVPMLAIPNVRRQFGLRMGACIAVWSAITCLCASLVESDLYTVILPYFLTLTFLFVTCYGMPFAIGSDQMRRSFHFVTTVFIILMTALCCVALYAAATNTVVPNPSGSEYYPACIYNHRLEMFFGCVTTGSCSSITLFFCLLLLLDRPHPALRVLYILCIPITYFTAALSDARIPIVCIDACIGGLVWLVAGEKLPIKRKMMRMLASLALAGVVMLAFFFGTGLCIRAINVINGTAAQPAPAASVSDSVAAAEPATAAAVETNASAEGGLEKRPLLFRVSTLNGRTDVWLSAIRMFEHEPIKLFTGTSPGFVIRDTQPYLSPDALNPVYPHMHSLFFQVLTALGIPGLLLYAVLLVYITAHALRVFFCGAERMTFYERGISLIPLFYLVMDFAEVSLWFAPPSSFMAMLFYTAAGYTVYLSQTRFTKKLFQKAPPICGGKEANA